MAELELFRRFPESRHLAHVELATLPTPVEELPRLASKVDIDGLWVKRDDQSGEIYGGNKVRKLEFILGHAQAEGHREVWTVGAVGSHHVLATCLYARKLGITPRAMHFPQPLTAHVQEVLAALSTTSPELELVGSKYALPGAMLKSRIKEWLSRSPNPYYIPGGGSSPRGVLGYVNAALELARQIDNGELPMPDAIFVAAGTCGTLAGLILGAQLADLPTRIVGVRVVDKVLANPVVTASLANRTAHLLRDAGVSVGRVLPTDVEIIDDQIGEGYGVPTDAGEQAMDLVDKTAGLELEPTYTAKAFAGLLEAHQRERRPLKNILYWHTLSSVDLGPLVKAADPARDLPPEYAPFLEQ